MLTKKQHQVLVFIDQHINQHQFAPSLEEIAHSLGATSRGSVLRHIKTLEEQGYIEREANKSRQIRVIKPPETDKPGVPLVGKIAAGQPIIAFENIERVDLNTFLNPNQNCFLLQVKGESMIDCGIIEGDYVLIDPQSTAKNGQIVVALVDGYEATLKRLHRNNNQTITLIPENKSMKPMTFAAERVMIQGVMVGQIRNYRC